MVAGDPALRKGTKNNPNVCHRCWVKGFGGAPCDNQDTWAFPDKPCPGGIRSTIIFPSCWDGKNLDSPDHQSHMYSTTKGGFRENGPCPKSHPVRMPQLAYETMWNTTAFKDMWPTDGSKPFVWSYSDHKGYGTHADCMYFSYVPHLWH